MYMSKYLAFYNLAAFLFWLAYLLAFAVSGFTLTHENLMLLNVAQGLAVLEIVHAALRWVKSPVASTIAQVGSRLLVLALINWQFSDEMHLFTVIGIFIVSWAWSITEVVRYSSYFLLLIKKELTWLTWMRYSFFILLYPIGITGEWLIIVAPIVEEGIAFNWYFVMAVALAAAYIYYFPVLYGYMWKQRKKKIGTA